MRIEYLTSTAGFHGRSMNLTTYLVNETIAIDAGVLGLWSEPRQQARVHDIILTHSHLDHVGTLPMFLDNVFLYRHAPVRVHATIQTQASLDQYVFKKETWAPLTTLLATQPPMLELVLIEPGTSFRVGNINVEPVLVDHSIECLGLLLTDEDGTVAISSDTGPTELFWKRCAAVDRLQAVYLECSFPSQMHDLAMMTCHLTPTLFAREMAKLDRTTRWFAMHLKPAVHREVAQELASMNVEVVEPGHVYDFGGR
ncbi:MBL fold metallo-hydrolase [bacterium]|nr:MBL fold metallo-hydrolase [bacterium]